MCLGGGTLAEINEKAVNAVAQILACGPSHFRRCLVPLQREVAVSAIIVKS